MRRHHAALRGTTMDDPAFILYRDVTLRRRWRASGEIALPSPLYNRQSQKKRTRNTSDRRTVALGRPRIWSIIINQQQQMVELGPEPDPRDGVLQYPGRLGGRAGDGWQVEVAGTEGVGTVPVSVAKCAPWEGAGGCGGIRQWRTRRCEEVYLSGW